MPFRRALWLLIVLGTVIRVVLAFTTFGAVFDINNLARVGAHSHRVPSVGRLHDLNSQISANGEPFYGWPYPGGFFPLILTSIFASHHTPLPFHGLIQLPSIVADSGLALLVQSYLGWRGAGDRARLLAAGSVALGPIFIAISGYHGQIDSVAFLPAVLALIVWEGRGRQLIAEIPWARVRGLFSSMDESSPHKVTRGVTAGLLIGIGAAIKTLPLFMIFALLPSARSRKEALSLVGAAAAAPLFSVLPFLIADPGGVLGIANYRAAPGLGGISLIIQPDLAASWLSPHGAFHLTGASVFLYHWGPRLLVVALLLVAALIYRFQPAPVDAVVLLWTATYVFTPGFFFQYLIWGMPFMLMAGYTRAVIALQLVTIGPAVVAYLGPWPNGDIAIPYAAIMISVWLGFVYAFVLLVRSMISGSTSRSDELQGPYVEADRPMPVRA